MGIETITESEFKTSICDCISGKKDRDLVKKVDGMAVCSYQPIEIESKKPFCKCIEAIYSCNKGIFYACGKNLVYAEKPKA